MSVLVLHTKQPAMVSAGVQVGVEKVTLNGRIRLTLKPLMDDMPIVAAIQVSMPYSCGLHTYMFCLRDSPSGQEQVSARENVTSVVTSYMFLKLL